MKTTYILHGGSAQHINSQNDLFFREILKRTRLDRVKVLLVHFAGSEERTESNKQRDTEQFERNKGNKSITIKVATKDEFREQMSWANVIYFGGGTTVKLLEELSRFPDLNIHFEGKVIAGESAGKEDMALISGVIWNRLLNDQPLEIDATVQYARGNTGAGWWAPIKASDIDIIDSPYNTYKHSGLPPTPISNPGIDAIEAALNPEETDCFYYIHDNERQIHCATTLEEHEANIDMYLK